MTTIIDIDNDRCAIWLHIKTKTPCKFHVVAEDLQPNSKYADRTIQVDKERSIYLSFPVSPKKIKLSVICLSELPANSFEIKPEIKALKSYEIWQDQNTRNFLDLAIPFSQTCGFELPPKGGRLYQSDNKKFNIKYVPTIRDFSGKVINTPARIGHKTGKIEISAQKYIGYTIPMRMMILLHEFSHKFKNPEMGVEISNEVGADINALYIYLGLGFSKVDAIFVYANVFLGSKSQGNIDRMRKIMNYIAKFENQEFAKQLT